MVTCARRTDDRIPSVEGSKGSKVQGRACGVIKLSRDHLAAYRTQVIALMIKIGVPRSSLMICS